MNAMPPTTVAMKIMDLCLGFIMLSVVLGLVANGYIVFKSDYRGHGHSDGVETVGGGYGMPDYTADVLNAVASLQTYPDVDPERIGMRGPFNGRTDHPARDGLVYGVASTSHGRA